MKVLCWPFFCMLDIYGLGYLGFPTGLDSATFQDKVTEVPSLFRDKGPRRQAQNLAKGQDRPGQVVKIRDGMRDGTVQDFDGLSCPAEQNGTEPKRTFKNRKRMF